MRKKILGLSLAMFALTSISAMAQNQEEVTVINANQETICCVKENNDKCKKTDKKDCKAKAGKIDKKGNKKFDLFRGIELTEVQKAKIKNLKESMKASRKAEKEAKKETRAKERENFNAQLATILTPEQMAQYNANRDSLKVKKENKGFFNGKGKAKTPKKDRKEKKDNK